jgi:hypothetical protein
MTIPLTGGYQCGKLRYEISETPRLVYCCHCTSCQKITASAFSISAVVIEEAFHLTVGQPHVIYRTADMAALAQPVTDPMYRPMSRPVPSETPRRFLERG